jgi:hypothetical protein
MGDTTMNSYPFRIPPEIFATIFRLAAGEPFYTFDTSPLPPFSEEGRSWSTSLPDQRSKQRKERARTRTRLVLVSKLWRSLALELLYESVMLKLPYSLCKFVRALHSDITFTTAHNELLPTQRISPVSWFVRRLEIRLGSSYNTFAQLDDGSLEVLSLLSNVNVLILRTNGGIISTNGGPSELEMSRTLAHKIVRSGCRIAHYEADFNPSLDSHILQFTSSTLEVARLICDDPPKIDTKSSLSLPHVHRLELRVMSYSTEHLILRWFAECQLPSLRRLRFELYLAISLLEYQPGTILQQFWSALGQYVTFLDVNGISWSGSRIGLRNILRSFPSLQKLVNSPRDQPGERFPNHLNLVQIDVVMGVFHRLDGIMHPPSVSTTSEWKFSMNGLIHGFIMKPEATLSGHCLERVRLIDISKAGFGDSRWRQADLATWQIWIDQFRDAKVRLEFSSGDLVVIPDKIMTTSSDNEGSQ